MEIPSRNPQDVVTKVLNRLKSYVYVETGQTLDLTPDQRQRPGRPPAPLVSELTETTEDLSRRTAEIEAVTAAAETETIPETEKVTRYH